jgi:hypothetical protein
VFLNVNHEIGDKYKSVNLLCFIWGSDCNCRTRTWLQNFSHRCKQKSLGGIKIYTQKQKLDVIFIN